MSNGECASNDNVAWPDPLTRQQMQRVMNIMRATYPMLPEIKRIYMYGTVDTMPDLECWAHRDKS